MYFGPHSHKFQNVWMLPFFCRVLSNYLIHTIIRQTISLHPSSCVHVILKIVPLRPWENRGCHHLLLAIIAPHSHPSVIYSLCHYPDNIIAGHFHYYLHYFSSAVVKFVKSCMWLIITFFLINWLLEINLSLVKHLLAVLHILS